MPVNPQQDRSDSEALPDDGVDEERPDARRTASSRTHRSTTAAMDYVFTEQVGYLLRRAYQRHLAIFQANAAIENFTAVQFSTLCALDDGVSRSQAELVRATGIDQATIRGIVDRLKARDLVALSKDAGDGRKVIITITDAGRRIIAAMTPSAIQSSEDTLSPLNPGERLALLYTLRRIADIGDP